MRIGSRVQTGFGLMASIAVASTANAQWADFVESTDSRLVLDPLYAVNDNIEKDFAWADFDRDGWIDLAIVRKFPGSIEGGARNLLLMNEAGVLVDRTDAYASLSDVVGDNGFLSLTNDRDVKVADFDNDGWPDLVTSTTMSDDKTARIGQPRIYMNLGEDIDGNWLGFRFEDDRIPELRAKNGSAANPRACAIDVGDLNNDGYDDLYFVDYDTPETSGLNCIDLNGDGDTDDVVDGVDECNLSPAEDPAKDYDGKFLLNQGAKNPGFFTDTTTTRMTSSQLAQAFGNECAIRDVNGDGLLDVIRVNTLTGGQDIAVLYQTAGTSWVGPVTVTEGAPYGMNAADLDNDGDIDIVTADDGQDAYMINNGNNGANQATWTRYTIGDSLSEFGNSIQFGDLDQDGWTDMLIADVDSDLGPFCPSSGRRMHIYRNTGVTNALFDEDGFIIPEWALQSTYDSAPIDLNRDGWPDLVIGACYGISVWMNNPPIGIDFTYPSGLPSVVAPGAPNPVAVDITSFGGTLDASSPRIEVTIDGGLPTEYPMSGSGTGWTATLPGFECGQEVEFAFAARLQGGGVYRDPPVGGYELSIASDIVVAFEDDMESGDNGWTTTNDGATAGAWERADPIPTTSSGQQYAPGEASDGQICWVTQNGAPGGSAGTADLDGGPVTLTSPAFDLADGDATVMFDWWFVNDDYNGPGADSMLVQVSNGGPWVTAREIANGSAGWSRASFLVGDHVTPTATVRVRFQVADNPNTSLTEVGIDAFRVERIECEDAGCPEDLNGDGTVDGADMGLLIAAWGTPGADIDGDGTTNGADMGLLIAAWGTDC
ncbi:MAG: FG-GAP-like repeat-containing protein [Planctomycetota bacterium]|nr:FG-GAP-like repeat-containing protein [Planctomycetota bacterium]